MAQLGLARIESHCPVKAEIAGSYPVGPFCPLSSGSRVRSFCLAMTMHAEMIPPLVETHRYLGLSTGEHMLMVRRWTLYRWLKSGSLRDPKPGRQWRILVAKVERLLGESRSDRPQ